MESTLQTNAREQRLLSGRGTPFGALQRIGELEHEVALLRGACAALPPHARRDPAWNDKIAQLLSRIVLFRVALNGMHDGKTARLEEHPG